MIPAETIAAYNKLVSLGLKPIIMHNLSTGVYFVSLFSSACYRSLFYKQIPYLPEANKQVLGTGKPKIYFTLYK